MRINVKLFARLRDIAGTGEIATEVPDGATVRTVWDELTGRFPELRAYQETISAAVNADYSRLDAPLGDGDEVAFLPPVSGG